MYKPLVPKVRYKTETKILYLGDGINQFFTPFDIKETEASNVQNGSSREYPAFSVIPGRQEYASDLTTANGIGQRNNADLHVQDGTVWKYWNGAAYVNVQTGITSAIANFVEFSTGTTKYTILANGTDRLAWNGSAVTDLTNAPLSRIVTTHKGRIYWARDNDIVYSALNLINDYSTPNDAGTIDVTRAKGASTGIYEYNDKVIAFTEYGMHELYGTGPSNYELIDIEGEVGTISNRSIVSCNRVLYFVWYDGIYAYTGGSPIKISNNIENYFKEGANEEINFSLKTKIVSGSIGNFLYIAVPSGSGTTENNKILVYDTERSLWNVESGAFTDFVTIANNLYGVDSDGKLWDMVSGTDFDGTAITWFRITKPFNEGSVRRKKTLSDLWVVADLPVGSTMTVSYSTTVDNDDFVSLYTFTANADEQNTRIQIPTNVLQNIDWYRLKFSGTGPAKIHYIDKVFRTKYR